MLKRMVLLLAATTVVVAVLGYVKFREFAAAGKGMSFQPPPEAVTTIVARNGNWPATLSAIGTVAAVQGVTVSADLPGVVDGIEFDSGQSVREGDVLVRLDTRQEEAQLAAAQSQRELARVNYQRLEGLVSEGAISRAEYDKAAADQKQTDAGVGEIRATIARKIIRAPFSGILGIRQVNLGQYLASGDRIVVLQSLDPIYVDFNVPQEATVEARVGRQVRIATGDGAGVAFEGQVTAIDSTVDEATRNIKVRAVLANPNGALRPGMFVQAEVMLGAGRPVVALPASAISYAPYGDSVFIVGDLQDPAGKTYRGVRQQFVKLAGTRGDQVAVVSGVRAGDEVVTSGVFKLRNGAAVQVNNKVRPANNPAPKPEDS